MEKYEPEVIQNGSVSIDKLYKSTRLTSVVRARAKIQNEYKLFLASEEVRKHRGKLEDDIEGWAISDQPDCPQYAVFIDESGKDRDFLIIGSLWIIDSMNSFELLKKILELRERTNFEHEFHFKNISEGKYNVYEQLVDLLFNYSSSFCFKFTTIKKDGISDFKKAIQAMIYSLLVDGIKHENASGRASLPRSIQLIKDSESAGSDQLMMKEIKNNVIADGKLPVLADENLPVPVQK